MTRVGFPRLRRVAAPTDGLRRPSSSEARSGRRLKRPPDPHYNADRATVQPSQPVAACGLPCRGSSKAPPRMLPMKFRTRAIHVGNPRDAQTGAVIPPIHLASTYVQPAAGEWGAFDYGRSGNPTRKNVETTLGSLESGSAALAFASGMAAVHAVTMLLRPGDQILAGTDLYGGTYRLLHKIVNRAGLQVALVPTQDLDAVERAIGERTRLLWLESPGNPLMTVSDIAACADRPSARCSAGRRQHAGHTRADSPAGTRCRRGHALRHKIPGRTQ